MKLIIGGAYQGKLRYALETYHIDEKAVCDCAATDIDFTAPCIDHIERFALACVQAGRDPVVIFEKNADKWRDAVLICCDISGGVVPIDETMRRWREAVGRLTRYLAGEAGSVTRLFCSLPERLK